MFKTVFLGGTCGNNHWREDIVIPALLEHGVSPDLLFNPVVEDWDAAAQAREDAIKADPRTLMVFVIANPKLPGQDVSAYSLVEAIMGLYDAPHRTAMVFVPDELSPGVAYALGKATADLRKRFPAGHILYGLTDLIDWLATILPYLHQGTGPADSFKQARGVRHWKPGDPLPEEQIRRLRDGES